MSSKLFVSLFLSIAFTVGIVNAFEVNRVGGSTGCGGSGRFIDMDSTGCLNSPCNITVNTSYLMGITFIAGESSSNVIWQVWLYTPEGGVTRIQNLVAPGNIISGTEYRISNDVIIAERYANIPGEIAIMVLNGNNQDARMICGEFPVFVV